MSASPADARPFRLGLWVDSLTQPAWVRSLVTDLRRRGLGEVVLVIRHVTDRADGDRRSLLHSLYLALDWRLFHERSDDAVTLHDLSPWLGTSEVMQASGDSAAADSAAAVRRADLDVLLVFGARPPLTVCEATRHGAWTFEHGAGNAGGFSEVMHGRTLTPSALLRLSARPADDVPLVCSWSSTERRSTRRTSNQILPKSSRMAAAALTRLRLGLRAEAECASAASNQPRDDTRPGNLAMLPLLTAFAWRNAGDMVEVRRAREQWVLGVRWTSAGDAPAFEQPPADYILPPPDRFWADPFPIERDGRHFVFVEELLFGEGKGHISVLEVDRSGLTGPARRVLVEDHHLSYPSVFESKGSVYMTPEAAASRRLDLYRATRFPDEWEHVAVLMPDVLGGDPTIFRLEDTWWMFVNLGTPGLRNYDECHLFYADDLAGPWHPHPLNPIRSDARSARPAGRTFMKGGKLYRPAQDCSVRYGYATVIHEIERLSRTEFREREVARIDPVWRSDQVATHTLNHAGALTVWDCMLRRARS